MIALVFLPALVIGEKEKNAAAVNFQPICDFNANEIKRLKRNKEELKAMVQLETDLYKKLKNSSSICGTIGYLTLPDCAKKEGMKEGMNVFDKLDDKCAEDKTNRITMSLQKVLSLVTKPSGQEVFRSCKDIVVKNILEQFEKMQGLICSLCDKSTCVSSRRKRSYGGGYYPGGYDPSTIWFQYLLCHEQKISCYFFTQGWNEKDYGQYYLYENVFDTDFDSLGHPVSSGIDDNFLALALLAGAGGSHQAYPSYKKRREAGDKDGETTTEDEVVSGRRRRSSDTADDSADDSSDDSSDDFARATRGPRWRRSSGTTEATSKAPEVTNGRRRRSSGTTDATKAPGDADGSADAVRATRGPKWQRRRRSSDTTDVIKATEDTSSRRRRSSDTTNAADSADATKDPRDPGRRRRSSGTTEPTTKAPKVTSGRRRRRGTGYAMVEMIECVGDEEACS